MSFSTALHSDASASRGFSEEPTVALTPDTSVLGIPGLSIQETTPAPLGKGININYSLEALVAEPLEALINPLFFAGTTADEVIISGPDDDVLTGNGGRDTFVFAPGSGVDIITDFGGVGSGDNGEAFLLTEYDVLKFEGSGFVTENMLLSHDGQDTTISFTDIPNFQLILRDFDFTDLDNLP
ncbi:MAG: hypothetical protein AAGL17_24735, partial [Cyanobacteria bacterium J06576_12]